MSTENYDPYYPDQPVVDQYLPVWAKQPAFSAKPAFIWADDDDDRHATGVATPSYTTLTYSDLNSSVHRMALALLDTLRRGDTVLLLASPGLRLVTLIFACQRAGLVAVPIVPPDPSSNSSTPAASQSHRHLLRAVSQTKPSAAVADAAYIDTVMNTDQSSSPLAALKTRLRWVSVTDLEENRCRGVSSDDERTRSRYSNSVYSGCGAGETYLIQYTSGATGSSARPVVVSAGAAAHNARAARRAYGLHPGSVVASWLPQYHDCGLMFLLLTIVSGATCVLASPAAFLRRPRLWLELVAEFGATCTPVPCFALPLLLKREREGCEDGRRRAIELGSLRNLILVNEPVYEATVEEFVREFGRDGLDASAVSPSYGLAENCTFVSTAWRRGERLGLSLPSYKKLLPSARLSSPSSSTSEEEQTEIDIVVVDARTGEPVEDGVEGEIWVSSPSNASGYLGQPSATRDVLRVRLLHGTRTFVRTGDCGVVRGTERYLYVLGRTADVIAIDDGRRRVHAHYVETAAFGSSPDSLRGGCVAAFAATRTTSAESVVVVVAELQKGRVGNDDVRRLRGICDDIRRAVWEEESVEVGRVVLAESGGVPKTTSGKLRRGAARDMLATTGKMIPKVFEVVYYDEYADKGRATLVRRGGEKEETEVCGGSGTSSTAGWVVGEAGGDTASSMAVVMASGNNASSHRGRRLQSSL